MLLKLGTRKSLLALAQSLQVAKQIEDQNPGVKVELVGIETQGDRIQDVALGKIEGKEFFVAELDSALSSGQTDLSVHSLKDLSLDRPKQFTVAAIPKREDSRDVIVFNPEVLKRFKAGQAIRVGTSSPRRLELLPGYLSRALPFESDPIFDWVEIRGNVNTRLSRIFEDEGSPKKLDGVVLAAAGLNRLWQDGPGKKVLLDLLGNGRAIFMVLPLSEVPSAPGQGALAVECRVADVEIVKVIQKLHDPVTAEQIQVERAVLGEFGGGCHQRFGASQFQVGEVAVTRIHGQSALSSSGKGRHIDEWRWNSPRPLSPLTRVWDGHEFKSRRTVSLPLSESDRTRLKNSRIWWVSHVNAWTDEIHALYLTLQSSFGLRVWAAGVQTATQLSKKGVWVEGSSDSFGILAESHLRFMSLDLLSEAPVLTHKAAAERDSTGRSIAVYQSELSPIAEKSLESLRSAQWIYWSSFAQFQAIKQWIPSDVTHSCGTGKTAIEFKKIGVDPVVFPNHETFQKWVQKRKVQQ